MNVHAESSETISDTAELLQLEQRLIDAGASFAVVTVIRAAPPTSTHVGAQALVECGRVLALMRGRYHLAVEDILHVAPAVLRHRIILNFDAHADGQTPETILQSILKSVTAPSSVA